ncbi:hypothetical protein [Burkholderia vietnamiensis]|uniref:hypothetical protein n=1 Tax=Burkholderia vietnamiensis TaxID=60552 RepID=UPI000AE3D542|nr:hypothetical protein [Burkholderia vietnamiensis]
MKNDKKFNGRTLAELKELCTSIEDAGDCGFDATLGDETEGSRTILALLEYIEELAA